MNSVEEAKDAPVATQRNLKVESNTNKLNPLNALSLKQGLEEGSKTIERTQAQDPYDELSLSPREPFPFAGYLATLSASLLFANAGLCVKLLPVDTTIQEKVKACMIRGLIMILYSSVGVFYRGYNFKLAREEYLSNFLRTLFGSLGMMSNYIALNYISVGESNAVVYLSPIWTCLLNFILLGEPLKFTSLVALPASLLGILLIARPDLLFGTRVESHTKLGQKLDSVENRTLSLHNSSFLMGQQQQEKLIEPVELDYYESRLPGVLAALSCSILMACIVIVLKLNHKKSPIETCSFYLGIGTVLICAGVQSIIGFGAMPNSLFECSIHFYIGSTSYFIQFLFQWALQFVPANIYSVTRSLDIMFGFLLGATFLQELVPWTSIAGALLAILVVAILVLDEHFVRGIKRLFS